MNGIGILEAGDGKVKIPGSMDNPFMDQLIQYRIANPAVRQRMQELAAQEVYDACNGLPIIVNLEDMEKELYFGCNEKGYTVEALEEMYEQALFGKEVIIRSGSLSSNCSKVNCLIEKFQTGAITSTFFTDICEVFEGDKNPNILFIDAFDFSTDSQLNPNALAYAYSQSGSDGKVRHLIRFNSLKCNSNTDNLSLLETFFHELFHIKITDSLLKLGLSIDEINSAEARSEKLQIWATQLFGNNAIYTDHQIMLNGFMTSLVNAIKQANGGQGVYEDYEGLVLNGFNSPEDLAYIFFALNLTKFDIKEKYDRYRLFITNGGSIYTSINPTINNCN